MIRTTDNFTLRRVAGQLAVAVGPVVEALTASQARDAAEAFAIMVAMMDSNGCDENEQEVLKLEDAA